MVIGSLPEGFTLPNNTSDNALPASCPGKKVNKTARTSGSQGISIAPGDRTATTTALFTAAICSTKLFWKAPNDSVCLSEPSVAEQPTTITTTSAVDASDIACVISSPVL